MANVGNGPSAYVLTGNGVSAPPTWKPASAGGITTVDGDVGSVTGATISLLATPNAGTSVQFNGSSTTMDLNVTNSNFSTYIGKSAGSALSHQFNTSVGYGTLASLTGTTAQAKGHVAMGYNAGTAVTTGIFSTALGFQALVSLTTGDQNTAVGNDALATMVSGSLNTAIGVQALDGGTSGSSNVGIGFNAGTSYTGSESSNILISNVGVVGESNVSRIGTYGTGGGQQNKCYIAACYSNYGTSNTFVGELAGNTTLNVGNATFNTSVGYSSLNALAGSSSFTGTLNTCMGYNSGLVIANGYNNSIFGFAGYGITSGFNNTAMGTFSLAQISNGNSNTCIGFGGNNGSGVNYTSSESSNVCIANQGTNGESNVIRIGTAGSGAGQQNVCYIAGINGVTVTGTAVLCSTSGQLGTILSSERYKENINTMQPDVSVLNLRPVEFNYKQDSAKTKQYGLIAEEVDKTFPYLCFYNGEGLPESVKYHELPVLLLAEIQRLTKRVEVLEASRAV